MPNSVEVRFHLVGGQTVTVLMPLEDGATVTPEMLSTTAKEWRDAKNLWLAQGTDWASQSQT